MLRKPVPAGIVQRRPATVIPNPYSHIRLVHEVPKGLGVSAAAGHVEQAFAKSIAAGQAVSPSVQRSNLLQIVLPYGRNNFRRVGGQVGLVKRGKVRFGQRKSLADGGDVSQVGLHQETDVVIRRGGRRDCRWMRRLNAVEGLQWLQLRLFRWFFWRLHVFCAVSAKFIVRLPIDSDGMGSCSSLSCTFYAKTNFFALLARFILRWCHHPCCRFLLFKGGQRDERRFRLDPLHGPHLVSAVFVLFWVFFGVALQWLCNLIRCVLPTFWVRQRGRVACECRGVAVVVTDSVGEGHGPDEHYASVAKWSCFLRH
mmetsp:Transcript_50257/g.92920  ORF Transcript_50257/g.92920 Transcript_50257/m.92920 type:complete len:312 (+) Transcript_50257:253-1188(+)